MSGGVSLCFCFGAETEVGIAVDCVFVEVEHRQFVANRTAGLSLGYELAVGFQFKNI
jgi:hypothetical protein